MRTVLVGGLAMLALSVVTAASASAALPEFKPVPTKKKFTATGGAMSMEFYGIGLKYECTKSTATGEITGAHTLGNIVTTFTGCKSEGAAIHSKGAKEGEIVTAALGGELGTVKKSGTTGFLVGGKCCATKWADILSSSGGNYGTIYGSVAAEVSGLKSSKTHKLYFTSSITEITLDSGIVAEPELETDVAAGTFDTTDELTFEEAVEVT